MESTFTIVPFFSDLDHEKSGFFLIQSPFFTTECTELTEKKKLKMSHKLLTKKSVLCGLCVFCGKFIELKFDRIPILTKQRAQRETG